MALFQKERAVGKVLSLPICQIHPNPAQPRRHFDQKELESLGNSIKENGLLQPVTVCRLDNGEYQLIAGERRLCASKLAGRTEIEAILIDADTQQSAVLALLENIQRSDLNCFEEAEAIRSLLTQQGLTQEEAAQRLGFAQSTIANKLRLLKLSPQVREALLKGSLGERHGRAILPLTPAEQLNAIQLTLEKGWNAGQLEEYVRQRLEKQAKAISPPKKKPKWLKDSRLFVNTVEKTLRTIRHMGFQVESTRSQEKGYLQYVLRFPLETSSSHSGEKEGSSLFPKA